MINDYSQHGEGRVISDYFNSHIGTAISIGENDGKTLSNVLGLIEQGWSAYLIEPCLVPFNKMKELHKGNKSVHLFNYAIGLETGEADFYESGEHLGKGDTSLLSTLNESEIKRWKGTCEFKKTKVKVKTFNDFLRDSRIANCDLISIDCEGLDFDILKTIPLHKLSVAMIIIETNSVGNKEVIDYMFYNGYKLHYNNFCNLIFVK